MGQSSSTSSNARTSSLDKDVLQAVKSHFSVIAKGKAHLEKSSFDAFSCPFMGETFRESIHNCMVCSGSRDKRNRVTVDDFIRFAEFVFGGVDEQAECIPLLKLPLRTVVEEVVSSFLVCEKFEKFCDSQRLLVDYIMRDAPADCSVREISSWLSRNATFPTILVRVFKLLMMGASDSILPTLSSPSVLTPAAIVAITMQLPAESRLHWKLQYSSSSQGESFTKLMDAVNSTGASLIVVETSLGRVFGCFANAGFVCGPSHTGDSRCFLFEDRTVVAIHSATGFNTNFAYLNCQQVSFPNGLGMGGTDDNWSFFIKDDFTHGTSAANISTFEKCWIAGENDFSVKHLEAWRIGKAVKRKRYDSEGNEIVEEKREVSALDRDPAAKAVLALSGKKMYSDGFREPPPED